MSPSVSARALPRLGTACDECRRRKQRCDGQQPACRICRESGLTCQTTQRGARGPKKGYIKALKDRVLHLEALLQSHVGTQPQSNSEGTFDAVLSTPSTLDDPLPDNTLPWLPATNEAAVSLSAPFSGLPLTPMSPLVSSPLQITNMMHAELDQLYFDRVHPSIPILHQRRYLSWSKAAAKSTSRICLQHTMWTLVTLLSTQFTHLTEPLYQSAKQMLESLSLESKAPGSYDTELVQAWVLITTYESMRTYHQQAWMSAGRAFRLVQAFRFHQIDMPAKDSLTPPPEADTFIDTEEKRRVFWMAYFLDHLFSVRNDWPVTLNEHVICTRLPAPESEFQSSQYALGSFLSEAMTETSLNVSSPFNECLILATLCGRSLMHDHQHKVSKAYGDLGPEWEQQHQWINYILTTRLEVLSKRYPLLTEAHDPLLLFANILGQTAVVYYCKGMIESMSNLSSELPSPEYTGLQSRAVAATTNIVSLEKAVGDLHFSKIHPLMPIPLFICAEFLYDNYSKHDSFPVCLQDLVSIFYGLTNVNNHEQSYVDLLPRSCISKTKEMLKHGIEGRGASAVEVQNSND